MNESPRMSNISDWSFSPSRQNLSWVTPTPFPSIFRCALEEMEIHTKLQSRLMELCWIGRCCWLMHHPTACSFVEVESFPSWWNPIWQPTEWCALRENLVFIMSPHRANSSLMLLFSFGGMKNEPTGNLMQTESWKLLNDAIYFGGEMMEFILLCHV